MLEIHLPSIDICMSLGIRQILMTPQDMIPVQGKNGSYIPDCGVDGYGIDPSDITPLTQGGREAKALYKKMKKDTSGWWYADGSFTYEDFLGIILVGEASGWFYDLVSDASAQSLFVGGWNPAYCSKICFNGAFNFLGTLQVTHEYVDIFLRDKKNLLGYGHWGNDKLFNIIYDARFVAQRALHPAKLNNDQYNAPSTWGNISEESVRTINDLISNGKLKVGIADREGLYFIQGNFVVASVNQIKYLQSLDINMSAAP